MKLFHSPTSPFVRKVLLTAAAKGLRDHVEVVTENLNPVTGNEVVKAVNPLSKVPALVTDEGQTIYDSSVICAYLDTIGEGGKLTPEGPDRFRVLTLEALADGMTDAMVLIRYETALRPEEKRWPDWIEGQRTKIVAALDEMERQAPDFGDKLDTGTIAVIAALGYLDFRYGEFNWRADRPALAAFAARMAAHPDVAATIPKG